MGVPGASGNNAESISLFSTANKAFAWVISASMWPVILSESNLKIAILSAGCQNENSLGYKNISGAPRPSAFLLISFTLAFTPFEYALNIDLVWSD